MADEATNQAVIATRRAVDEHLVAAFDGVERNDDGTWSLTYGSAVVHVGVKVFDEDGSVVLIDSPCVTGATVSPELYEHVATANTFDFGHLSVTPDGETATITFSHSLLGDFLDSAELRTAVVAVAYTADELDDALAERFGGEVYDADGNAPGESDAAE